MCTWKCPCVTIKHTGRSSWVTLQFAFSTLWTLLYHYLSLQWFFFFSFKQWLHFLYSFMNSNSCNTYITMTRIRTHKSSTIPSKVLMLRNPPHSYPLVTTNLLSVPINALLPYRWNAIGRRQYAAFWYWCLPEPLWDATLIFYAHVNSFLFLVVLHCVHDLQFTSLLKGRVAVPCDPALAICQSSSCSTSFSTLGS